MFCHKMELHVLEINSHSILEVLKPTARHGGQNRQLAPTVLKKYAHEPKLHTFVLLKEYISKTAKIRTSQQLLCYFKSYGPSSRESIAHWIRQSHQKMLVLIQVCLSPVVSKVPLQLQPS